MTSSRPGGGAPGPTPRRASRGAAVGFAALVLCGLLAAAAGIPDVPLLGDPPDAGAPVTETVSPGATRTPDPGIADRGTPTPPGTALAAARALPVKGRAPRTGYSRDLFGDGWVDVDRNGCDTRNDVLARDLTGVTFKAGTRDCVVVSGLLADPYGGSTIAFVRGNATSSAVQVDHVVALADAWQKGAQGWDTARRTAFANDPVNLLAVDGVLNQQKGAGDTATWLPPHRPVRCAYVARQVRVKATYGLWVTDAEQRAMVEVLGGCPEEPLPTGGGTSSAPAPAPAPTPVPAPATSAVAPYSSCSAARAAGAAPVRAGDPGYGTHLDGDRDGVGCE